MNHLAHFLLAADHPGHLAGALLGDHVKGRLNGAFPAEIETGIQLHRVIDAYTDHHPLVLSAKRRFPARFYRVGGIMLDVIFDHFLALSFDQYHHKSLASFTTETFEAMSQHDIWMEGKAREQYLRMSQNQVLVGYTNIQFVERSFHYLASRLSRANPLAEGFSVFLDQKSAIEDDFHQFFPDVQQFVQSWHTQQT